MRERHGALGRFLYDHFDRLRGPDNYLNGNGSRVSTPDSKAQAASAQHAMAIFQSLGWTPAQAAGLAANVQAESGFNPSAAGDKVNGIATAYGAGQWHADRQANFAKWAGFDIHDPRATLDKQLQFYSYERTNGQEQAAGRAIRATSSAAEAGATDSLFGQRPANAVGDASFRARLADSLFKATPTWGDLVTDGVASPSAGSGEPLSANVGAPGAAGATGRVDVNINTPAGTKTTARATGNVNQPKIATAMPGAGPSTP